MAYQHVHTLAALALTAGLTACVGSDADANIVILRNSALTDMCVATGDPEGAFFSTGVIDVNSTRGYLFSPVVQNFAQDLEGTSLRIAFVHGARIDIHSADSVRDMVLQASAEPDEVRFQVPLSGSIDAGGTIGLIFEIVPEDLFEHLVDDDLLLVDVRIFGEMGGNSFESATFQYPVEVCDGCLVSNLGLCSTISSDFVPAGGHPCGGLQDAGLECCTDDVSMNLVCPAMGTGGGT